MDIRDLNWKEKSAGNTLIQEIEKLAKAINVPVTKRRDLRWMANNLRDISKKDTTCRCELKVLISYVDLALQQGINTLS